jgi:hypothetical protein
MDAHVIVIDDRKEFAAHAFRRLSQALEFGAGSGQARVWDFHATFCSPSLCVLYHDARDESGTPETLGQRIKRLLDAKHLDGQRLWCLLDVRVPHLDAWQPFWRELLAAGVARERIYLVSSYERRVYAKPSWCEVESKTPEFLDRLREEIRACLRAQNAGPGPSVLDGHDGSHILVTGAGFEAKPNSSATGLPPTAQLLKQLSWRPPDRNKEFDAAMKDTTLVRRLIELEQLEIPAKYAEELKANEFPPFLGKILYQDPHFGNMTTAAKSGNLDDYWDALLVAVNEAARVAGPELRDYADARGAQLELTLREAFRQEIAKYDIGEMAQHKYAASSDRWTAWLTTNYTGFADRGIASAVPLARWRSVRTTVDATVLQAELMLRARGPFEDRLFVKLHGDLAQVQTMALAASDKRSRSRLAVYPGMGIMYATGTEWLTRKLRDLSDRRGPGAPSRGMPCTWHIVGHSLRDAALLELLRSVVESTAARCTHDFVIVSDRRDDAAATRERLLDAFKRVGGSGPSVDLERQCRATELGALAYMVRTVSRPRDAIDLATDAPGEGVPEVPGPVPFG